MQVYHKAGLHKYMCMYGKVAQCIHHWHIIIIIISTHIYVHRSRMINIYTPGRPLHIPHTLSQTSPDIIVISRFVLKA